MTADQSQQQTQPTEPPAWLDSGSVADRGAWAALHRPLRPFAHRDHDPAQAIAPETVPTSTTVSG